MGADPGLLRKKFVEVENEDEEGGYSTHRIASFSCDAMVARLWCSANVVQLGT